jgi:membrane-associated phospholipid phosphatase
VGFLAFVILRNAADNIGPPAAFDYVISLERTLCLGLIPSAVLQAWLGTSGAVARAGTGVYLTYFLIPPLSVGALWRWQPARFRHLVAASLGLWGTAVAWHILQPTAPPWLASREGHLAGVSSILQTTLHFNRSGVYQYGARVARTNYVAAMPSVHMGITWLLVLAAPDRWWRAAALGYAALMLLSIVYLGDHYVVDGIAGAAIATGSWQLAGRVLRNEQT